MDKKEVPYMRKPCGNCPFRKDSKGIKFLGKKLSEEIKIQNMTNGFVCHKTADYSLEDEQIYSSRKQCAGAMILAKKTQTPQPFVELYEAMFNEEIELENKDSIVDNYEQFIKIQS